MGRQVNFFMHPDDLPELEAELRDRWSLLFYPRTVNRAPIDALESLALDYSTIAPRDEKMYAVLSPRYDADYGFTCYYNGRRKDFMICVSTSPVIEFHRCFFDGKVLKAGRMYFVPQDDPAYFVPWADSVLKWVRRRYTRVGRHYAGPCAIVWRDTTLGQFDDSL